MYITLDSYRISSTQPCYFSARSYLSYFISSLASLSSFSLLLPPPATLKSGHNGPCSGSLQKGTQQQICPFQSQLKLHPRARPPRGKIVGRFRNPDIQLDEQELSNKAIRMRFSAREKGWRKLVAAGCCCLAGGLRCGNMR